ncbi:MULTISPECIES: (deoxy)nucleoside triphosphate pyrophosphohydrolase [Cohnella]|uniref:(deoxy)nucleoside triphosphate pyrophosphohydrolase n=1 Tax=Cohnella TaxID=329857 RepID=UPI0009BC008E|nr:MULTISPECIES: (deoxy)nucleoside triphosphate pyrophosphohydrolase [Cohnella]MBN2981729.1 (deoxy)nucleoside triphosphate pyrophosphohydrolase [Cohnella algarum]
MVEVAAAVIEDEAGRILIARRKKGKSQEGLWEFPGGKIEPGESVQTCLRRELLEEMNIEIAPGEPFAVNEHDYGPVRIRLTACMARYVRGEIRLADHDECRWVGRGELREFRWAPADVPFVERLAAERI